MSTPSPPAPRLTMRATRPARRSFSPVVKSENCRSSAIGVLRGRGLAGSAGPTAPPQSWREAHNWRRTGGSAALALHVAPHVPQDEDDDRGDPAEDGQREGGERQAEGADAHRAGDADPLPAAAAGPAVVVLALLRRRLGLLLGGELRQLHRRHGQLYGGRIGLG